jgi:hypothetical protein
MPQQLSYLFYFLSWGAAISESNNLASLSLLQDSDDTAFFVENCNKGLVR